MWGETEGKQAGTTVFPNGNSKQWTYAKGINSNPNFDMTQYGKASLPGVAFSCYKSFCNPMTTTQKNWVVLEQRENQETGLSRKRLSREKTLLPIPIKSHVPRGGSRASQLLFHFGVFWHEETGFIRRVHRIKRRSGRYWPVMILGVCRGVRVKITPCPPSQEFPFPPCILPGGA